MQRHSDGITACLAESRRENFDDPEAERDRRHFANKISHYLIPLAAPKADGPARAYLTSPVGGFGGPAGGG